MTTTAEPVLEPLRWDDIAPADRIISAALGRDRAVLALAQGLVAVRLDRTKTDHVGTTLDPSAKVVLSATGEYVAVSDAQSARVWKWGVDEPLLRLPVVDDLTTISCSFGVRGGEEIFVCSVAAGKLDAYELPSGARVFAGGTHTFRTQSLASDAGATHLAAIGFFYGETKDSLAVVPLSELAEPGTLLEQRFARKRPIADYAYRLATGPCGDAFVFFRDPEDDEDPDEEEEEPVVDTSGTAVSTADVRGHRGFYVRGLDGSLRAKVVWDGPIKSCARLAATQSWIAAECGDAIALVPLLNALMPSPLAARWLAVAPDGARILVELADGTLAILTLPA